LKTSYSNFVSAFEINDQNFFSLIIEVMFHLPLHNVMIMKIGMRKMISVFIQIPIFNDIFYSSFENF
jgi:hypothetical protein